MGAEYDDIKDRITLSTLVSQYIQLKRYGDGKFKALCPFHSEKTPSFYVDDEKGSFVCYACSLYGDVIDFLQRIEAIDHMEAVKRLKQEAGIEDIFMTKGQKRDFEVSQRKRMEILKSFRRWKQQIVSDLISYTNAQWSIFRTASRQFKLTPTEELEKQINDSISEGSSREAALDTVETMSEVELLEWYATMNTWKGVRNPKWLLSGWRKDVITNGRKV